MNSKRNEAVIFDMDGVIIDSSRYHYEAWQKVFGRLGFTYRKAAFKLHFGRRSDAVVRYVMGDKVSAGDVAIICAEKESIYREIVKPNVEALPGVIELIKSLWERGYGLAVGSSAAIENINIILEVLSLNRYFDAVVHSGEVKEAKPSPEIFLLAADRLGATPECCLVIEEAVPGVQAAKRAVMSAIAVTGTHPREELGAADLVVDSLLEVSLVIIERLIHPQK